MAIRPGELDRKLRFEQRGLDANGDPRGPWDEENGIIVSARVRDLRGSEAVVAQRLEGVQPVAILIRNASAVADIDSAWRAVDVRSGRVYELVSPPAATPDRAALEFMARVEMVEPTNG